MIPAQICFPKGDLRRMLAVLAAIAVTPDATLVKVSRRTGLDRKTVVNLIRQARVQALVVIDKEGPVYRINHWGPLLKRAGVIRLAGTSSYSAAAPMPSTDS